MIADRTVLARDVLIKPVVSEKSYSLLDLNVYTFIVDPRANKTQIKDAVETLFEVRVTSVNTLNRQGKRKRTRTGYGKRKDTKRAIVTIDPAPKEPGLKGRIDIFGGPVS
jgi:large subunit ribosomal protein L23